MDDGWQWGEVSDGGQRGIKYDARVISTMGQGALVVCDTFVEFAPLLAQARNMRDALADMVAMAVALGPDTWNTSDMSDEGAVLKTAQVALKATTDAR